MMSHKWRFTCMDNGGKRQSFTVKAQTKDEAIRKSFEKAKKNAKGDIMPDSWHCALILDL